MSQIIDNKIVEMEFDNSRFERNVEQSMSTLDKLTAKLNMTGATKGLSDVETAANRMDLSGIAASVDAIQNRFSTMGIVGMTAIQNITTSVMNLAARTFGFFKNGIISGGISRAMNLEQARFQLQGLLGDTDKGKKAVDDIMKDVDYGVRDTAYRLDSAALAASQFAATGMRSGALMRHALRGVSGVAAMTGAQYEEIAQIFTTVSGNGRLMGEQLLQISSRGLNAAATIRDFLNDKNNKKFRDHVIKLGLSSDKGKKKIQEFAKSTKLTEENVRDLVSAGAIDFKTFATAMDETFGPHAKKANETVKGAFANIKAAMGKIGALFVSPMIQQNGPLVKFLNAVKDRLNEIKDNKTFKYAAEYITTYLNGILKSWAKFVKKMDLKPFYKMFFWFMQALRSMLKGIRNIFSPILKAFNDAIDPVGKFENVFGLVINLVADFFDMLGTKEVKNNLYTIFYNLFSIINKLISPLFKVIDKIGDFLQERYDSGKQVSFFEDLTSALAKFTTKVSEFIESIDLSNIVSKIKDTFKSISESISEVLNGDGLGNKTNIINGGILVLGLKALWDIFKKIREVRFSGLGNLKSIEKVVKLLAQDIPDTLFEYQRKLKADQLMGIAKAIAVLAASLLLISLIKPERLALGIAAMSGMFGMLGAFFFLINKTTDYGRGMDGIKALAQNANMLMNAGKIIAVLNGIATSIVLLSVALKILSTIDPDSMGSAIVGMGAILLALGLFVKQVSMDEKATIKGAGTLIVLATSLLILSVAVKSFASMKFEDMARGIMGVAGALATILIALKLMPDDPKSMLATSAGLVMVATALLIIGKAIKNIGGLKEENLERGLVGIGVVLIELAIALQIMKSAKDGIPALIAASGALGVLAISLLLFSTLSWKSLAKGFVAIAGALVILGVAAKVLKPLLPTIGELTMVLLGFSGAIALFGLGLTLIGIGLTAISTGLAAFAAQADVVVMALKIFIDGIVALIPSVTKLFVELLLAGLKAILLIKVELVKTLLDLILECLKAIEKYVPQIVDIALSILVKVAKSLAERVPELVTAFGTLVAAVFKALVDAFKNADTDSLLKGVLAVGLMAGLTYVLSSIVSMIPMAMVGLAGMGAMIAELSLILAAIGKLSEISGLTWLITEGGNFLQVIGTAIGQFIGGIIGGVGQGITASLPVMGTNLSEFMTNLRPFLDGASTINPAMAEGVKALAAAILIITAADVLDSLTSWLTGGVDLAEFASSLVPFGEGIKAFSNSVAGIDAKSVNSSALAAKAIAEMAKALPNSGGLVALFSGDNNLGKFAPELKLFGEGLKDYATAVAGINLSGIQNAEKAVKSMVNTINSTAEVDTSGVSSFKSAVASLGQVQADQMAKAFKANKGELKSAGESMTSALKSGLTSGKGDITSAASSLASSASKAFSSSAGDMTSAGTKLIGGVVKGFKSGKVSVTLEAQAVAKAVVSAIKSYVDNMKSAGKDLVAGLADGILAKKQAAVNAAKEVAKAVENATKNVLDINSPSRVFRAIGAGVVEGFVQGIDRNVNSAVTSSTNMANRSVSGFSKALNSLNTIIDEEIDANPTITPVLDLTSVQEGSGYISDMLDMASTIGLDSNTGPINNLMNQNLRNTVTNSDVVSAIDKLNKNLANVGNTYNSINGVTYDDGSNIYNAISEIANAALVERRS